MSLASFWQKNKVFILGLLTFVAVSVQQLIFASSPDYKAIGYSAAIAVFTYFARHLTGKIASIIGAVGTSFASIVPSLESGAHVGWAQIGIQTIIAVALILGFNPTQDPSTTTTSTSTLNRDPLR